MEHGDRHADDLRETWQFRALCATRYDPIGMVVLSVVAHSYDDAMPFLMNLMFPGFYSITTPFICSTAKVNKYGRVVADVMWNDWQPPSKGAEIFPSTHGMRNEFRRLADRMKLSDPDRREMFAAVRRWCNADQRLDPTMDPADPDAKRLTLN